MKVEAEEFKRVILEIAECFKQGAITPVFQSVIEQYKEEIEYEEKEIAGKKLT